jgi:hypothetical protein
MDIIEIELDSPAGEYIRTMLANPNTHTLYLSPDGDSVKVKANAGMWTPPLLITNC